MVFQAFRAATVTSVVLTTTLASTATGGPLRRPQLRQAPGTGSCFTALAIPTGATTISRVALVSAASGIKKTLCLFVPLVLTPTK